MQRTVSLRLVAVPDAARLTVYGEVLGSMGYATIAWQTAREAQRHIHSDRPDFVIVALHLDWYASGWDLICLLRQVPTTATISVIVYTIELAQHPDRDHLATRSIGFQSERV